MQAQETFSEANNKLWPPRRTGFLLSKEAAPGKNVWTWVSCICVEIQTYLDMCVHVYLCMHMNECVYINTSLKKNYKIMPVSKVLNNYQMLIIDCIKQAAAGYVLF